MQIDHVRVISPILRAMCGRFTHLISWAELRDIMNLLQDDPPEGFSAPRYNIAPTQLAPIIRADRDTHDRRADMVRWGFAPRWSKEPAKGPINARVETGAEKPMFREAMQKRRCIVPASGFYEWQTVTPGKPKHPWYITPAPGTTPILAFAGLWESHPEVGHTFCILTTAPNALMRPIHDRMPVILTPAQIDEWLSEEPIRFDASAPYPDAFMHAVRVGTKVNKPANDDPSLIRPVEDSGLF